MLSSLVGSAIGVFLGVMAYSLTAATIGYLRDRRQRRKVLQMLAEMDDEELAKWLTQLRPEHVDSDGSSESGDSSLPAASSSGTASHAS